MCLALYGTVHALREEGGVPVALVRVQGGPERWCGVFATGVGVGSAVLLHSGYVVDVLDPERAAEAAGLRPSEA